MKFISWLTQSVTFESEPVHRRARVLAWMQLTLIFFLIVVLVVVAVFNFDNIPILDMYFALILIMVLILSIALVLNYNGKYLWAAGLTVFCAFIGPWLSILVDPSVLQTDFVPLVFLALSVTFCSIFLPSLFTIVLTLIQFALMLLLLLSNPMLQRINWPSLYTFIFFISITSIVAGIVGDNDMKRIAKQTGLLMDTAASLREMAVKDTLTGLYNRRYLDDMLEREASRSDRKQTSLGIIIVDIDHYKQINDTYGHAAGDDLLTFLGVFLKSHIRISDIACRYGGDEFVLVMPEAQLYAVTDRAQRICDEIKLETFQFDGVTLAPITVSAGVAVYPLHGKTITSVLKLADTALYEAKRKGRDQVSVSLLGQELYASDDSTNDQTNNG